MMKVAELLNINVIEGNRSNRANARKHHFITKNQFPHRNGQSNNNRRNWKLTEFKQETHSFQEWLQLQDLNPEEETPAKPPSRKKRN
jgi:hypothetical protein